MKVLVQWTTRTPRDYTESDSANWAALPKRRLPIGGETIDEAEGWVHALLVQGVVFQGYDHYAVENLPDGACRVTVWKDDPDDLPGDPLGEFYARVWTFRPLAPDARFGGAVNTRQEQVVYAGPVLAAFYEANPSELEVWPWSEFVPPPEAATRRGIWVPDRLHLAHEATQTVHGWREWGEDGPVPPQRPQGRFPPTDGTKTFGLRVNAQLTGIHDVNGGSDEFQQTRDVFGGGGGDTGQNLGGGESQLYWVWTCESTEPDNAAWPTGDYRCQVDIASAGSDVSYGFRTAGTADGHFARVNSGLTSDLETKTQTEALFSGVGLKLATTGSVSWAGGATGDRWECLLAGTRPASHGNQSLTFTDDADSFSDGPWVEGVTLTPAPATASWDVPTPTLVAGSVTLAPGAASASWGVPTPTLVAVNTILPTPVTASWDVPAPTVVAGPVTLSPAPASASWLVPVPTLSPGPVTLSPGAASATWVVTAPTVTNVKTLTPAPVTASWGVPTPVVIAGAVTLSPAPALASWDVPLPTISPGPVTLTPGAASASWLVPAPTVLSPATILPAPATASWGVPTPALVAGGVTLSPGAASASWTVPIPALVPGAVILTPGAATAVWLVPTASISTLGALTEYGTATFADRDLGTQETGDE